MIDNPANPLQSAYGASFLAAYHSATYLLKLIQEQYEICPELSARIWITWAFAFNAAVSVILSLR
jgi:hypothetical protein